MTKKKKQEEMQKKILFWKWTAFFLVLLNLLVFTVILQNNDPVVENLYQGDFGDKTMQSREASQQSQTFAQCLTDSGAKMYGAWWCPHCDRQKQDFGDDWQFINYVECSAEGSYNQLQVCQQAGITGYPTWDIQGQRYPGYLTDTQLSEVTGCPLN